MLTHSKGVYMAFQPFLIQQVTHFITSNCWSSHSSSLCFMLPMISLKGYPMIPSSAIINISYRIYLHLKHPYCILLFCPNLHHTSNPLTNSYSHGLKMRSWEKRDYRGTGCDFHTTSMYLLLFIFFK